MKTLFNVMLTMAFALTLGACGGVEPEESELSAYANAPEGVTLPASAKGAAKDEAAGDAEQTEENNEGGGGDQNSARAGDETCDSIEDCEGSVTKLRLYAD